MFRPKLFDTFRDYNRAAFLSDLAAGGTVGVVALPLAIGFGIANIACPFVGGISATGAIARTATNIRSGARTPVAGMIHSLTLLAIVLVAAPWARFIPLTALERARAILSPATPRG